MATTPTVTIERMDEFHKACDSLDGTCRWIFRGQVNAEWPLRTTLERALDRLKPVDNRKTATREAERFLLREFRRHFHRYSDDVPAADDKLEWLSLMQHHGAPTRLSDWTFSKSVALFFAINGAEVDTTCAVWAVNQTECWHNLKRQLPLDEQVLLQKDDKSVLAINGMLDRDQPLIAPLNPYRLSTRLSVQQGTFLVPLNTKLPFQTCFDEVIGTNSEGWRKFDIRCSREFLLSAFTELKRVNISDLSLFPGIDGLARSTMLSVILKHLQPQT